MERGHLLLERNVIDKRHGRFVQCRDLTLLVLILAMPAYPQEVFTMVKIDRKAEAVLAAVFDSLPGRIDVFIKADSTYVIEAAYGEQKQVKILTAEEDRGLLAMAPPQITTRDMSSAENWRAITTFPAERAR